MTPRRLLFVLEQFHPNVGGVETLFAAIATALVTKGVTVQVLTRRLPGTAKREVWNGIEIVRVTAPFGRRYAFTLAALPAALRLARGADLVHTTTYNAALPAWLAARMTGTPIAITVHEVFAKQWNELPGMNRFVGYGYRAFEWTVLHLPFDLYICPSDFTRRRLVKTMSNNERMTVTVYNGVDDAFWNRDRHAARPLRRELGLADDTILYLYFGRPGVSKGVEHLIEAVPHVRREFPSSKLVLIMTDDPPKQVARIRKRIADLGIHDAVIILPPQPRDALPGTLLGANVIVVPSLSEGFGYAAVESAMLGCNVVTTSGHAVEEVMPNHATFVPPRDAEALASAIVAAATRPAPHSAPPLRFPIEDTVERILEAYAAIGTRR